MGMNFSKNEAITYEFQNSNRKDRELRCALEKLHVSSRERDERQKDTLRRHTGSRDSDII